MGAARVRVGTRSYHALASAGTRYYNRWSGSEWRRTNFSERWAVVVQKARERAVRAPGCAGTGVETAEPSPRWPVAAAMVLQQCRRRMVEQQNSAKMRGESSLSTWTPRVIAYSCSGCSRSTAASTPQLLKPPAAASDVPKSPALSLCSTWAPAQLDTATTRSIPMFSPPRRVVQLLQPPHIRLATTNAARMAKEHASCSDGANRRRHQPARSSCTLLANPRQASRLQLHVAPIRPTIAPVRRAITRRRSQEDLRVHRVLDSMKRSGSDEALSPQHGSADFQFVRAGTTNTLDTRRQMPASSNSQDVRQAEVDVTKLMAEMAAMAQ